MALLTYTGCRLVLFAALAALFYWAGAGIIVSIVAATLGALCLAYLFLPRQRADAARALERLVHRRPKNGTSGNDSDAAFEDELVDRLETSAKKNSAEVQGHTER